MSDEENDECEFPRVVFQADSTYFYCEYAFKCKDCDDMCIEVISGGTLAGGSESGSLTLDQLESIISLISSIALK